MSGAFESLRWNACMHRLDLVLYSHPEEFCFAGGGGGGGARTHVNSKGKKMPSTGGSEEVRTRDAVSHRTASPTHYRLSYSGPCCSVIQNVSVHPLRLPRWLSGRASSLNAGDPRIAPECDYYYYYYLNYLPCINKIGLPPSARCPVNRNVNDEECLFGYQSEGMLCFVLLVA